MGDIRTFIAAAVVVAAVWTSSVDARGAVPGAERIQSAIPGAEHLIKARQARGLPAAVPAAFTKAHGEGWSQILSGPAGGYRLIWGEGIPVDPAAMTDEAAAEQTAIAFWRSHAELLPQGVSPEELRLETNVLRGDVRYVAHSQTVSGMRVLGTANFIAIAEGRIAMVGARNFPVSAAPKAPAVRLSPARLTKVEALATAPLSARRIKATARVGQTVVVPLVFPDRIELRSAREVALDAPGQGRWRAYVDAGGQELIALRDLRVFVEGTVTLRHHERHPESDIIDSPAKNMFVQTHPRKVVSTDDVGFFAFDEYEEQVTVMMAGSFVRVLDGSGTVMKKTLPEETFAQGISMLWESGGVEEIQAQIDAFQSVTRVRDHVVRLVDDIPWFDEQLTVKVNQKVDLDGNGTNDICNAFFDGSTLNFLPSGEIGRGYACNNTAMISDIIYHEYGHAVHLSSVIPYVGEFDEAVSEGFADSLATSITGDSVIGRYFLTNGSGIRDLEPDMRWPEDQGYDPHQTGLILGGALWDLRGILREKHGVSAGDDLVDHLFFRMMRHTSDMPSAFAGILMADDDNGDLADGTPNFCDIYDAFSAHGLVLDTSGQLTIDHEPLTVVEPTTAPLEVAARVRVGDSECFERGEVRVIYSVDGGLSWKEVAMSSGDEENYAARLEKMASGTSLLYRIEVDENRSQSVISLPANPAEPFYRAYVGQLEEIYFTDFEAESDDGWTHELVEGDEAREGSDDWMRGAPKAKGGDPEGAFSGDNAWGNDMTPEDRWDAKYQANITNALVSPAFDLSQYDAVRLQFRRWLTIEDGYFDKARVVVNGETVWHNAATPGKDADPHTLHHVDQEWVLVDLDITEAAAGKADVAVRFELESDGGMQMGGWNIDDFGLYTVPAPPVEEPPLSDTDEDGHLDTDPAEGVDEMENDPAEIIAASGAGCQCNAPAFSSGSLGFLALFASLLGL